MKTATFDRVVVRKSVDQQATNAHSLNLNLHDLCVAQCCEAKFTGFGQENVVIF